MSDVTVYIVFNKEYEDEGMEPYHLEIRDRNGMEDFDGVYGWFREEEEARKGAKELAKERNMDWEDEIYTR